MAAQTLLYIVAFSAVGVLLATLGSPGKELAPVEVTRIALAAQFLAYVAVLFFMYRLVAKRYRSNFWEALRWNWPERHRLMAYLAGGTMLALAVQISSALLPIPRSLPIYKFFQDTNAAYLMAVFGIAVAPFVEELFFRGFLYPVLARRAGVTLGVLLTSAAFAVVHGAQLAHHWAPLLMLFLVGLLFTVVRARTGSVAAPYLLHAAYNFTLFFTLYLATDRFRQMERMLE